MNNDSDKIAVGRVEKPHGVRGSLKIKLFADDSVIFTKSMPLYLGDSSTNLKQVEVTQLRPIPMGCLLTIKESDSELTAQGWSRQMLWIDKTSLPLLAADQFYHHELWQMRVEHPKHGPLGLVRQVVQSAGADYLVVAADEPTATATDEVMIPLIKIAIAEINRDARSIVLKADWHLQPE